MIARPGRLQSGFTAGELDPLLFERTELKYFSAGADHAENVVIIPQGGFKVRPGLRDLGPTDAEAARIFPFAASDGSVYDLVFSPGTCEVWGATAKLADFSITGLTAGMLAELTAAQQLDTMLLFHPDLRSKRIKHFGATSWDVDNLPYEALPNYDYGEEYTNGVPAVWQLEFVGLDTSTGTPPDRFTLTVQGETTTSVAWASSLSSVAVALQSAVEALPSIEAVSVTVTGPSQLDLSFELSSGSPPTTLTYVIYPGSSSPLRLMSVTKVQDFVAGPGGQPAIWRIGFFNFSPGNLSAGTVFELTVSQQTTWTLTYTSDMNALAASIAAAIGDLANVSSGFTVTPTGDKKIDITFSGAGNEGDGWAVSGRVVNKADAAILAYKTTPGVPPGEPVISNDRGWPACGTFYGQRLIVGGFKSLPNAWMFSRVGFYYSFDERFTEANGPALVPMDAAGGERIVQIVANRNLLIFTTQAEYWISERSISRTQAPNHVQASRNGARPGVPIVDNEGAALYTHSDGNVLSEFRYTDVEGNFVSTGLSVLAPHLMTNVRDLATRRATGSTSGNLVPLITDAGEARLVSMLREQEVTGFARMTSPDAEFLAVAVNARNEMSFIIERPAGRRFERLEEGLLLDSAQTIAFGSPETEVSGLTRFNGETVWALAEGRVFGPFVVEAGAITLPIPVSEVTVGTWAPPRVRTLPPPRTIGPQIVLKRKARIHSVQISVLNTTSIAIACNDGPMRDIDLVRYGAPADVPELDRSYSGPLTIRGLTGFADEPSITISQVRPGRLTVRSITIEAAL